MTIAKLLSGPVVGIALAFGAVSTANAVTLNPANSIEDPVLSNDVADAAAYDLQQGPYFWGAAFKTRDDAGRAVFGFENTTGGSQDVAVSLGTVLQGFGGKFTNGVTARWVGGESVHIAQGVLGIFEISKLLDAGEVGILKIIFGDPTSRRRSAPGIQLQVSSSAIDVSEVPVPPALALLMSGLAGMAVLARRRKRDSTSA